MNEEGPSSHPWRNAEFLEIEISDVRQASPLGSEEFREM